MGPMRFLTDCPRMPFRTKCARKVAPWVRVRSDSGTSTPASARSRSARSVILTAVPARALTASQSAFRSWTRSAGLDSSAVAGGAGIVGVS